MESSVWFGLCAGKNQIHKLAECRLERNEKHHEPRLKTPHMLKGKCLGRRGTEGILFSLFISSECAGIYLSLSAKIQDTRTCSCELRLP